MEGWLILIAMLGIVLAATYFAPRFLVKRAISQVILIFRGCHAVDKKNAKTVEELGLAPPTMWQRMMRTRDYKPYALDILTRNEIVMMTEDGKLYLSEDRLASSHLAQPR